MTPAPTEIRIGLGSCGIAAGAEAVLAAARASALACSAKVTVKAVGCNGMCYCEPRVEIVTEDGRRALHERVAPEDVPGIVRAAAARASRRPRGGQSNPLPHGRGSEGAPLPHGRGSDGDPLPRGHGADSALIGPQKRVVLENCGEIDPLDIDEYIAHGGYGTLARCVRELSPQDVVEQIRDSGLRGRGGAGFPTAAKWQAARAQSDPVRFVICNGDEGDPGAFMDRLVLESDPQRVIEGLAIAAYAVGARRAYFYVRAEYPHALRHVRAALQQAEQRGLVGERVCGSDFSLELKVCEGAGAFVCGEETALIASLESQRGTPRLRPPYPVESGLGGHPTVINNVETLACVPWILRHGPRAFSALGTPGSRGTKVFALAGSVVRGGLIEVPMGISIRAIVDEIGGGIRDGRAFKAVQIGGPSGGCLPASLAETPIDYEALARTGAIMGSGGLVVLDDRACMVDLARYFLRFTQAESCGKCTFCRVGTKRMLEILDRLCAGEGRPGDLAVLEELADRVSRASLCGLGQTAPNPVLSTLRYFRDEYEAHLHDRRCPAGRCPKLIRYRINERCTGCTLCAQHCPVGAIAYRPYERHDVDDALCTRCDMCYQVCRDAAVEVA